MIGSCFTESNFQFVFLEFLRPSPPFFLLVFILYILVLLRSYTFIKFKNAIFLNQGAMCSYSS